MYSLYPHNQFAYDKLKISLETKQRACIVQPTGTGKSYITAEFLKENPKKRFLLLTSNNYIIDQFNEHFKSSFNNYNYISYPRLLSNHFKDLLNNTYDYIILDEFHRIGAELWGAKVTELLNQYSNTKVIGMTATHIRYMEEERDMIEELFNGNIVHHLTLMECFDTGILPRPKYISTIYNIDDEFNSLIKKINNSNSKNKYQLKERIIEYKANWEYSNGANIILKKHIKNEQNFLIFCKDIEHLEEMLPVVRNWFKIFKKPIKTYKVYSTHLNSKDQLKAFKKASTNQLDEFNLLFSIQQLNEGLHVPNIEGVLFLRPTDSHIIYYQQLGRSLETKGKQPIVFDMVNNFKKSKVHSNFNKKKYEPLFKNNYLKNDYDKYKFSFDIVDEVKNIEDVFQNTSLQLTNWNEKYNLLVKELNELKNFKLLSRESKEFLNRCRTHSNNNSYNWIKRKEKLNKIISLIGFDWKEKKNNYSRTKKYVGKSKLIKQTHIFKWDDKFDSFKKDLENNLFIGKISDENKIWFSNTRKSYIKNSNKSYWQNRIEKLNTLNHFFETDWNLPISLHIDNENWNKNFSLLKKDFSFSNTLNKENKLWLKKCSQYYNYSQRVKGGRNSKIWEKRYNLLLSIGFDIKKGSNKLKSRRNWNTIFEAFKKEYLLNKNYSKIDSSYKRWFNLSKHNYNNSSNKELWNQRIAMFEKLDTSLMDKFKSKSK